MPRPTWLTTVLLTLTLTPTGFSHAGDGTGGAKFDMARYMQGRMVYEKNCIYCHGRRGRGDGPWAEGVEDKPRDFRSGIFKFRSTPVGFLPTDDDLRRTVRTGISGTMMPAFTKLTEADLDAVILYIKNLSTRWNRPELKSEPQKTPDPPAWMKDGASAPAHAKAGAGLYSQTCSVCHGPLGKGDGPGSKGLKDVWGHRILPADLSTGRFKSGPARTDLYRTISLGLDGTPMVGFKGALKPGQIWDLIAYIESLKAPTPTE